mmetsp:Transcript_20410/g.30682  ORF Transcript_20410/g.30682 Transcript_20410/m.30682 type:complete len:173 (-) Transcript_20410:75-593(-)
MLFTDTSPQLFHFLHNPATDLLPFEFTKEQSQKDKYHPKASIYSNNDSDTVKLTMDLPGVKAGDLDVQVQNEVLSVSGKRSISDNKKLKFSRKFELDTTNVNPTSIAANLVDGVLTITMQKVKKPEDVMMKIAVTTNTIDEKMLTEDEEKKNEEKEEDLEEEEIMVESTNDE